MDNINMDFGKIGSEGRGWISLAHDSNKWRALVNATINEERRLLGCYAMWLL
jgi:hypothetical protein